MSDGLLVVLSGPSGSGKGTVLERLLAMDKKLHYSISATTRSPRAGEVDGQNYFFIDKSDFLKLVDIDEMLEFTKYCDNYYGTPRRIVTNKLEQGFDVLLEIETEGAMQIKDSYPNAVFIFVLPPSMQELERRLRKRGTETDEVIQARLEKAKMEMTMAYRYDYIVVNDDPDKTAEELFSVIKAEKNTTKRMINEIDEVLENA